MRIALFPNIAKAQGLKIGKEIYEFLKSRGVKVVAEEEHAKALGCDQITLSDSHKIDFRISIGGDGTILRMVHNFPEIEAPVLGINHGGLGFMADLPLTEIYQGLEMLLSGQYKLEERVMMEGVSPRSENCFAVNEIVIHRSHNPCLIDLALHVDGSYINTFSADGIIVSTPNGSTAYSMAAGGPILTPTLNAFLITPICPHTISNRPIVLLPEKEITIEYISDHNPIEVTYDGFANHSLSKGETYKISPSSKRFKMVALPHHDFFSTLRTKLGWSGRLKTYG